MIALIGVGLAFFSGVSLAVSANSSCEHSLQKMTQSRQKIMAEAEQNFPSTVAACGKFTQNYSRKMPKPSKECHKLKWKDASPGIKKFLTDSVTDESLGPQYSDLSNDPDPIMKWNSGMMKKTTSMLSISCQNKATYKEEQRLSASKAKPSNTQHPKTMTAKADSGSKCQSAFEELMKHRRTWAARVSNETKSMYCFSVARDASQKMPTLPSECRGITLGQSSPPLKTLISESFESFDSVDISDQLDLSSIFTKMIQYTEQMFQNKCASMNRNQGNSTGQGSPSGSSGSIR